MASALPYPQQEITLETTFTAPADTAAYRHPASPILTAGVFALLVGFACPSHAQEASGDGTWDITLGAGAALVPEYEGADDLEVKPIPVIDITWNNRVFFNSENGLGVYVLKTETAFLAASVSSSSGRDEDDSDHLEGLGDIDGSPQGRIFAGYDLGTIRLIAALSRDFGGSDGSDGLLIDFGAVTNRSLTERLTMTAGVSATWADDEYMKTYFGVNQHQSQRSGLRQFEAGAGFKRVDLSVGATYQLTTHWGLGASAGVGTLLGDAADSSVTEDKVQPFVGIATSYTF